MTATPDSTRPTLLGQLKVAGAILGGIVVLLGGAYGMYYVSVGRPLLTGDHEHDFGSVVLAGNSSSFEHTFDLANRTRRTVHIQEIKTSCGCTVAAPSRTKLEPGDTVQITATLSLRHDGRKVTKVFLNCGDDGIDVLRLEAAARYKQRLVVPADFAVLQQGVVVERAIQYHDYDSDETPPAPRITAPGGVKATFTQWRQLRRRQPSQSRSARWFGRLRIEQVAEILTPNAALLVRVGDDQEVTVPLFAKASAPRQGSRVGSAATRPQEE